MPRTYYFIRIIDWSSTKASSSPIVVIFSSWLNMYCPSVVSSIIKRCSITMDQCFNYYCCVSPGLISWLTENYASYCWISKYHSCSEYRRLPTMVNSSISSQYATDPWSISRTSRWSTERIISPESQERKLDFKNGKQYTFKDKSSQTKGLSHH